MPGVSVLIPCHNHAALLSEAVQSVLAQSSVTQGLHLHIIIVNDGSTDHTREVMESWQARESGRIIGLSQPQRGQALARAAALEQAQDEFIVLLDADDLLESRMLEQAIPILMDQATSAAAIGQAVLVAADGRRVIRPFNQNQVRGWPEILEYNPYGVLAACLFRTESVRAVGGLGLPGTPGCEDWDLWVRLARAGQTVLIQNAVWGRYRQSAGNYSRQPLKMLRAELELLERAGQADRRLQRYANAAVPIAAHELARLRNGRVFHALGLALGNEANEAACVEIIRQLIFGGFDSGFCCTLGAWGLQFARDGRRASLTSGEIAAQNSSGNDGGQLSLFNRLKPLLETELQRIGLSSDTAHRFIGAFSSRLFPSFSFWRRVRQRFIPKSRREHA